MALRPYGIIYLARHRPTGKVNVGQTGCYRKRGYCPPEKTFRQRKREHHDQREIEFDKRLDELGAENFDWSIIAVAYSLWELNRLETHIIALYQSDKPEFGFNIDPGGNGVSESTRKKMSEIGLRRGISPETRAKMVATRKANGWVIGPNQRKLQSERMKGRRQPEEVIQRAANSRRGKKRSAAANEKSRLARQGKGGKLTEDQVKEILLIGSSTPALQIAKLYRVNSTQIIRILNGERWAHVFATSAPAITRYDYSRVGALNRRSRLTEQDVLDIRRDAGTTPAKDLAEKYGVAQAYIYQIARGKSWSHLDTTTTMEPSKPRILTEADVLTIRAEAETVQGKELARRYGVSRACISNIVTRKTFQHI